MAVLILIGRSVFFRFSSALVSNLIKDGQFGHPLLIINLAINYNL
jgi:hypothetical protein